MHISGYTHTQLHIQINLLLERKLKSWRKRDWNLVAAVYILNVLLGQRPLVPGTDHSPSYLKHLLHLSRLLSTTETMTQILTKNNTYNAFFLSFKVLKVATEI